MSSPQSPKPDADRSGGRRLGIKAKLLGMSLILLAFTAVIGVVSIRSSSQAASHADAMYSEAVVALKELGIARSTFNENRAILTSHILSDGAAERKELEAQLAANVKTVTKSLEALSHTLTTPEAETAYADLQKTLGSSTRTRIRMPTPQRATSPTCCPWSW